MRLRLAAMGGMWVVVAACSFDHTFPSSVVITCAQQADCPAGLNCNAVTGRCVRGTPDEVPPSVSLVSLRYVPLGEAAVLGLPVDALGPSSQVTLELTASESLASVPALSGCQLHCVNTASAPAFAAWNCSAPDASVVLPCEVSAQLIDLEGNQATVPVATIDVDTVPPPAPDTADGGFLYQRAPWGTASWGPGAQYSLSWPAGSIDGDVRWLWAGEAQRQRGLTVLLDAGSLTLDTADGPRLWVRAFDRAGNASALSLVRDVEWVAALGNKVEGSVFENPHRAQAVTAFGAALDRADVRECGGVLGQVDGGGVDVVGSASWERKFRGASSAPAANGLMAVDRARGRVVAFGGYRGQTFFGVPLSVTTEWNGSGWQPVPLADPEGDGTPSGVGAMVYDPQRKVTWLFSTTQTAWSWNGVSWALRGPIPTGFPAHAAWDEAGQRVLVLGVGAIVDAGISYPSSQWWSFDGAQWQRLLGDGGSGPEPTGWAVSATDRRRGTLYVLADPPTDGGALWRLDGDSWAQVAGSPAGFAVGLVFDEVREVLEAFTVEAGAVVVQGAADGGWLAVSGGFDAGELGAVATLDHTVWDSARGRTLLTTTHTSGLQATWEWDGSAFTLVDGTARDLKLVDAAGLTCGAPGGGCLAAASWADRDAATPVPFGAVSALTRAGWVPVVEPAPQSTPVFDSVTSTFTSLPRLAAVPEGLLWAGGAGTTQLALPDGGFAALPPDGGLGGSVLALASTGGAALAVLQGGTAWAFDGGGWAPSTALPINARVASAAAADGGAVVQGFLFGVGGVYGTSSLSQWTPSGWVTRPAPPYANGLSLMWNSARQRLMCVGGYSAGSGGGYSAPTNAISEENGALWRTLVPSDPEGDGNPLPRVNAAFDDRPAGEHGVLVGGMNGDRLAPAWFDDTWFLHLSRNRPAVVFRVDARPAGVPGEAVLTEVRAQAVAGAQGRRGGGVAPGVQGWFWRGGLWTPAGAPSAYDVTAPGPLMLSEARPVFLRDFVTTSELAVAFTPAGDNGADLARLHVDQVELTVHYRLP